MKQYAKWTIDGDKKTEWICGCFQTTDDYFKFCDTHNQNFTKKQFKLKLMNWI